MCAYRIDDGPLKLWTFDQEKPDDLCSAIQSGATIVAFNAQFETLAFDLLAERRGWPKPNYSQYRDTMAAAAAMALPRSLEKLAEALDLPVQKDKEGTRLIRKFSMPRRPRKGEDPNGTYWNEPRDHPDDWVLFGRYCMRDVETEEAAEKRIVPLSADEHETWLIDQRINRRGVRIDCATAVAAIRLADKAKALLNREMRLVTDGYVPSTTQPGKLVEWVQNQGVVMNTAQKAEIEALLDIDDIPPNVRRAIEIRQEAAKTSVSKLQAMLNRASSDGRVRGAFTYHVASTGRWASTGVNLANLPRPRKSFEGVDPATLFDAIRSEDPDVLRLLYGDDLGRPLHLISDAIRGFIWSAPGYDLVQADYSGIEGAVIAWSSGEDWKVQAMHEIIADPSLPDLYRRTAADIMNMTTDEIHKKHPLRQSVGKVSELALGFGGGVSAFYSMSQGYGVKLDPLFEPVWRSAPEERREKAVKRYEACLKRGKEQTDNLSREAWLACELIKVGWRATNPAIAKGWQLREQAVREAIQNPGTVTRALQCSYVVSRGFLWCKLPSGRCLAYGSPRLRDQVWAEIKLNDGWSDAEVMDREAAEKAALKGGVRIKGATSPSISALGVDSQTKQWRRSHLYGGLLAENDTQAIARDLLVNGIRKAEAAGYPVIAHVYDEIICEVPRGWGDLAAFERLICELPSWAAGLPLTAGGFRAKRYRKD
jgi:DNA polymerase